jgi:hypothetical protein
MLVAKQFEERNAEGTTRSETTRRCCRERDPRSQNLTGEIEEEAGQDDGKDPAAQALGKKGGAARRDKLSPERRAEIARLAAAKRWKRPA